MSPWFPSGPAPTATFSSPSAHSAVSPTYVYLARDLSYPDGASLSRSAGVLDAHGLLFGSLASLHTSSVRQWWIQSQCLFRIAWQRQSWRSAVLWVFFNSLTATQLTCVEACK